VPAPSVKNLIFDLGGVILDLSVDHTIHAFSRLSGIEPQQVKKIFVSSGGFEVYEKGEMDDPEFRDFVRKVYKSKAPDSQIDHCWNQMLRGIPMAKLDLLQKLKDRYNVYLLSNTNNIHLHHINEIILKDLTGSNDLDIYFHKAYYSHRMRMRKPDAEIFEQVLHENELAANETLFLDDNAFNVEGAQSLGIQTVYVTSPDIILDIFND
jgi:epoxide hydrolase-like predicted phosphatase